jgi:molybdenum cofactor guanylyltransferase
MGRDKALLPWRESTLLDHAVARLGNVCAEVRILCGPEPRYLDRGLPVATDVVSDAGPLGGIHAGLSVVSGNPALFLAVDLPLVSEALLKALMAAFEGYDAVVPHHAGGYEPLCAVYGPGSLEPIRSRLEAGERKVTSFWSDVRVRVFEEREIVPFGDPATLFRNVNAPPDYAALTERSRRRPRRWSLAGTSPGSSNSRSRRRRP